MPRALFTSCGYYTAGAAGAAAATPMAGDTFVIPSFSSGNCYLENMWSEGADQTYIKVTSPRMHDNNQGIRLQAHANLQDPLMPWNNGQIMYTSDTPVYTLNESAAATGAVAVIYSFDDLPGVSPNLDSWTDIQPRINNISGVEVDLSAVPAIGQYSPGNAINSTYDNFKADTDYALLGYVTATTVLALSIQGQDTGNQKVGGPGVADPKVTVDWFIKMSQLTGRDCIPIINANNKGSTLVYQTDASAAAAQNVSLIFAELS